MRRTVAATFVLLAIGMSVAIGQEETTKKLIGTWVLVKGDGPPGANVEFAKDGKMTLRADLGGKEFKIEGTYTVKDEAITSRLSFAGKEKTEVSKIKKLTATELHIEDAKGQLEEYKKK
jgi:uncharacterized protein (TIGR03066 family)